MRRTKQRLIATHTPTPWRANKASESTQQMKTKRTAKAAPRQVPTISIREFMQLPAIIAAQEIQKRNPYGSDAHRQAFERAKLEATKYNAQDFIGEY